MNCVVIIIFGLLCRSNMEMKRVQNDHAVSSQGQQDYLEKVCFVLSEPSIYKEKCYELC